MAVERWTGKWIGDRPLFETPKEGRWIAKPRKARFGVAHVAFIGLYVQIGIQLPRLFADHLPSRWIFVAIYAVLLALPLSYLAVQAFARRERKEDRALMDGGFGDQFSAELTIIVGQKRLGADRGVVWFADGLMGFSGRAASFLLAADDLATKWPIAKGKGHLPPDALVLVDPPRDGAYIVVTPLRGHEAAYRERLNRFLEDRHRPDGERQWPPLVPYDDAALARA